MSIDLSSIDLHLAKLKKLYQIGIAVGYISIIAGIAAVVVTITEQFPMLIIFLAIFFICFIIMWILQKKIDAEELKSYLDFNQKWENYSGGNS